MLKTSMASKSEQDRALAAGELIARGEPSAIPVLIDLLSSPDLLDYSLPPAQVWQQAGAQLIVYTNQDFGLRDSQTVESAQGAQPAWRDWWSKNGASLRWNADEHHYGGLVSQVLSERPPEAKPLSGGGTSFDPATNTFTVQVDLIGGDKTYEGFSSTAQTNAKDDFEAAINKLWNGAFAQFAYLPCGDGGKAIHFTLNLQIHLLPFKGAPRGTPGHHHIWFHPDKVKVAGNYVDDPDWTNPNFDSTSPYKHEMFGDWNVSLPQVIAHEVGHLLGLGDDYVRNNGKGGMKAYDKRSNMTIMFHPLFYGDKFNQNLIDRIGKQAQRAGQLTANCSTPAANGCAYLSDQELSGILGVTMKAGPPRLDGCDYLSPNTGQGVAIVCPLRFVRGSAAAAQYSTDQTQLQGFTNVEPLAFGDRAFYSSLDINSGTPGIYWRFDVGILKNTTYVLIHCAGSLGRYKAGNPRPQAVQIVKKIAGRM